jgi:3-dehydroquinate dehydratase-1
MARGQTRFGKFALGSIPRVVGTVSQAETLVQLAAITNRDCDVVEIRLDLLGTNTPRWVEHAQAIEAHGLPVVITIRLAEEGGQWTQPDEERLPLFEAAIRDLTAVDIELRSPILKGVSALASRHECALIVSYHDFKQTPPLGELKKVIAAAAEFASVIKIVTFTKTDEDVGVLRTLLHEKSPTPLCVMGMGPLGPQTRVKFPRLGSCLAYGYLDTPVAPNQVRASDLMRQLKTLR